MARPKVVLKLSRVRVFIYLVLVAFLTLMLIGLTMLPTMDNLYELNEHEFEQTVIMKEKHENERHALKEVISEPVILWWDGFTKDSGSYRKCGQQSCFFSGDRHYLNHHMTKVLLFYGSDVKLRDMPLPRRQDHEWGLLHEESPKNNYGLLHPEFIDLFNYTATFKRDSDVPLTSQYIVSIEWLESSKYVVSTEEKNKLLKELSPIVYTQSDCDVPSDRDNYVTMLMKLIAVDSYGKCVNNKELPPHLRNPVEGMDHDDFYNLASKYKFSIAMENAICDDYITEKIWRPLMVGSVPIIHGSPRIRDLLPDNHSAILVEDFATVKDLANYIKYLNTHDEEYNKYLQWKKTGVTNQYLKKVMRERGWSIENTWMEGHSNFIEAFECYVCNRVQENIRRETRLEKPIQHRTPKDHFSCPPPMSFDANGSKPYGRHNLGWSAEYKQKHRETLTFRFFADKNLSYTKGDFHAKLMEISRLQDGGSL